MRRSRSRHRRRTRRKLHTDNKEGTRRHRRQRIRRWANAGDPVEPWQDDEADVSDT